MSNKIKTATFDNDKDISVNRRKVLRYGVASIASLLSTQMVGCEYFIPQGGLLSVNSDGLMLLPGYTSRVIAKSGKRVGTSSYQWHGSPDGGETYETSDGGWIYVSNSELDNDRGGAGAIRFDSDGNIVDAYSILTGSNRNCAGGKTPWNTWLSCEEDGNNGRVFECDPFGINPAVEVPLLGRFNHEAVAVDDGLHHLYLTEDSGSGLLYRFVPDSYPDLTAGILEAAEVIDNGDGTSNLVWHTVADPSAATASTRSQVPAATTFNGGEGIIYRDGYIYFTTKGDDRVWSLETTTQVLSVIYDDGFFANPILTGVDGIAAAPNGDLFVAEDPGNMQVVALNKAGEASPIVQLFGHIASEVTGIAFSPDGTRMYFSSQRGPVGNIISGGVTYEVTGVF
ncbi:MAG: PhoX family protein [Pseudomonadales bacterium]|nr:PhoX family protein [Pseudomonadales bacterium]